MTTEESLQQKLIQKFPLLNDKVQIKRARRIFVRVDQRSFFDVFDYSVNHLGMTILCTITGLDEGDNLGFLYHLANEQGVMLNIETTAPKKNPVLATVMNYFPNAEIYERELVDLFGAVVKGLPEGLRYPLSDDWPKNVYPLRKDWKPMPHKEDFHE